MTDAKRSEHCFDVLIRKTVALESAAGVLGDGFLQYLYGMAILHLRERAGFNQVNRQGMLSAADRRQIERMAKRLIRSRKPKED